MSRKTDKLVRPLRLVRGTGATALAEVRGVTWKDGTHSVLLDPLDFVSRLCALIPPPRFRMLRYHGILAGHSRDRAEVVPHESAKDESSPTDDAQQLLFEPTPAIAASAALTSSLLRRATS